jgi:hypothetical protein
MQVAKWTAVAAAALVVLASGCRINAPVYNVVDAPVVASKANPSLDDVEKAIMRAGAGLGWQMKTVKPGSMVGTLLLRTHVAVVDINYNAKSYNINYKDSTDLKYDGQTIHPNYNGWIQNLDKAIKAQLTNM